MKIFSFSPILISGLCILILSGTNSTEEYSHATSIKTAEVLYNAAGKQCKGFIAYDDHLIGKRPVVIIVHEWWGLNEYAKSRAKQMAELGYFAFEADLFGNGQTASNPDEAKAFTKPYYSDPRLALEPIEAAILKAASFAQADTSRLVAMGYCFGGFILLNASKLGAPLKGTVAFHARLVGVQPHKDIQKGKILICQGGADEFAPETAQIAFKKSMDSVEADYRFISYPGAMHAYTNPASTELGRKFNMPMAYNAYADSASWQDMQAFFRIVLK